ncbi:carbohydrate ABC transporter permease [Phototrophicus methaneseepsis]|uniref:carbohydrate ABC transporter permease n=1 Tax=Phototrophicus methaneseepsis TaxID=2710758 RepID=UPI001E4FCCD9|nr:sugar ABC transporter permease [Phototrophicus methaneseepsis]
MPAQLAPSSIFSRLWNDRLIYLFLLPTIILFGLFTLYPMIASFLLSFQDWNGFSRDATYVGLANYQEVIADPQFWLAFRNTIVFMLVTVPIRTILALILALVLNNPKLPFAGIFRTALFLPVVTTTAIVGVVMTFVFDPVGGPVNQVLLNTNLISAPINFLGRSNTALPTAMGVHVWKWFGVTLIYWLAALQTVPQEVYEAARVDGANVTQMFYNITVPLLVPFGIVIVLITAIDTLRVFDLMLTLTGGGPFLKTEVVEVYIYRWAFNSSIPRLGYASAAAVFFGLTTLVMAILQAIGYAFVRRMRGVES